MKVKRIAMNEADEQTLNKLKKIYKMTNDEIISFCIQSTFLNTSVHQNNNRNIEKILEYVMLLVKTSKDLPSYEHYEQMEKTVESTSRFEELIEKKIKRIEENEKKF